MLPELVCAGIVARAALFSEGGWDAFSKAPTASNSVICFRSSFMWNRNQLGIAAQTAIQPKVSPPPAGAVVRVGLLRNGNGKSDRNRRILLPSQRSESVGLWYQQHLGILTIPRPPRTRVAAKRQDQPLSLLSRRRAIISGCPEGLDGELSSAGSRQNGGPATSFGIRSKIDRSLILRRFARLHDLRESDRIVAA